MSFIKLQDHNICTCSHKQVEFCWITAGLGPLVNGHDVHYEIHFLFKDKTRLSVHSTISKDDVVLKAEKYLFTITLEDDIKLKSSNYWQQRCLIAEKYISSRSHIPDTEPHQEQLKNIHDAIVNLRQIVKPW